MKIMTLEPCTTYEDKKEAEDYFTLMRRMSLRRDQDRFAGEEYLVHKETASVTAQVEGVQTTVAARSQSQEGPDAH